MEKDYQLVTNKMGKATTGTFRSAPLGIVVAESKLTPARPLLDYRQARFMQRLVARHKGQSPEEILDRSEAELTERLRQLSFLKPGELEQTRHHHFPEEIAIDHKGKTC